jgi:UDPglucose 6-dehydrogenase
MNIGFLGLGKLGLPVALAVESRGHSIAGHDVSSQVRGIIDSRDLPYKEKKAQEYLKKTKLKFLSLPELVDFSDIIFVSIQTPHHPEYEGITRVPKTRADFDYSYLKTGVEALSRVIEKKGENKIVAIISTVLPGTIRGEIKPLLGKHTKLCYNPFFIAMGTTIDDFFNPEFVLLGIDDEQAGQSLEKFYSTIHSKPCFKTNIENAELIKVFYNTFISTKLAFTNTVLEICHKTPNGDVDEVMMALKMGNDRIISGRYMSGGMGDGGGCHPRDNIALSFLAEKLDLSYDWFNNVMRQREKQTEWLSSLIMEHSKGRPIVILGKSFKAESNITTGSPSILLKNILVEKGQTVKMWDPFIDEDYNELIDKPYLYFIGTRHEELKDFPFASGSLVLDPWRYINDKKDIEVIRIGEG